jgi:uncharacterized RDD family membrane protein YckC
VQGLELEVTKGPWAGQKIGVNEEYRLGSAEPGPGTLGGDRWLSPAHARFHPGGDGWMLEDLGSLEGTKVNGRAIRGAVPLHVGDVIELGCSRIVVLPHAQASVAQLHADSPAGVSAALRGESRRQLDGRRLLAFVIDWIVLIPIALVMWKIGRGRWIFWVATIGLVLNYYFLCESLTGQTLGKRIARLKVVRVDGRPLVPSRVAGRTVLRLIDQQIAGLVGMLTMILSGGPRQRLGDLAARTAVVRSDAPGPRPARPILRERLALFAYPCTWLAPFVLLYALLPDARVLPCRDAGITSASGSEGRCLMKVRGQLAVYDVANAGHTLRMPDYSVKLVRTGVHGHSGNALVGFKLAVRNRSDHALSFDRGGRDILLVVTRPDGLATVPFREMRSKGVRIPPGRTRVGWAVFDIPPDGVAQLTRPVAGLGFVHRGTSDGYPHLGELRLWRASTPAGMRALSGLHD